MTDSRAGVFDLVLLVDDGELDNFLHQRVIEKARFAHNVVVRTTGLSALEYLKELESNDGKPPELIFLDINMPVMNGFQFLEKFKKLSPQTIQTAKIFILSSTINQSEINRITSYETVVKFIDKPLRDYDLKKIRALVVNI